MHFEIHFTTNFQAMHLEINFTTNFQAMHLTCFSSYNIVVPQNLNLVSFKNGLPIVD